MTVWKACTQSADSDRPHKAVFLDRDGVVIVDKHYLSDPDGVELLPGVAEAMAVLRRAGYVLVGLSNQSGIGRGRFTPADHAAVMNRLDDLLAEAGVPFDGFYFCPHAPTDGCRCRKPAPGLLEEAANDFDWSSETSWLVGDKVSDVELALGAGLQAALVLTGHGREQVDEFRRRWPDRSDVLLAEDLAEAAGAILARGPAVGEP